MSLSRYRTRARLLEDSEEAVFMNKLDAAFADTEIIRVGIINKAAQEDWKAAAWWLERRKPEVYGNKLKVTLEQKQRMSDEFLKTIRSRVNADVYEQVLEAILQDDSNEGNGGAEDGEEWDEES